MEDPIVGKRKTGEKQKNIWNMRQQRIENPKCWGVSTDMPGIEKCIHCCKIPKEEKRKEHKAFKQTPVTSLN